MSGRTIPFDGEQTLKMRVIGNRFGRHRRLWTVRRCPICQCLFGPVPNRVQRHCSSRCANLAKIKGVHQRRPATPEARAAQAIVAYAVRHGMLARAANCQDCGRTECRIEAAHYDYADPLRIKWLCVSCHRRWDKREPKGGVAASPENAPAESSAGAGGGHA